MNSYRGGPFQEAMSGVTNLNNDWYNGKAYQTYGFEYVPGAEGTINWFVGDTKTWKLDGRSVRRNGNIGQRLIPVEPMALVMNFGMSNSFAALNFTGLAPLMPATMRFDYVRIYQDPDAMSVTCDPSGMETTAYIASHLDAYNNPNKTLWYVFLLRPMLTSTHCTREQTSHGWPKNALVDECTAEDQSIPVTSSS